MSPLILYEERQVQTLFETIIINLAVEQIEQRKRIIALFISKGVLFSKFEIEKLRMDFKRVLA